MNRSILFFFLKWITLFASAYWTYRFADSWFAGDPIATGFLVSIVAIGEYYAAFEAARNDNAGLRVFFGTMAIALGVISIGGSFGYMSVNDSAAQQATAKRGAIFIAIETGSAANAAALDAAERLPGRYKTKRLEATQATANNAAQLLKAIQRIEPDQLADAAAANTQIASAVSTVTGQSQEAARNSIFLYIGIVIELLVIGLGIISGLQARSGDLTTGAAGPGIVGPEIRTAGLRLPTGSGSGLDKTQDTYKVRTENGIRTPTLDELKKAFTCKYISKAKVNKIIQHCEPFAAGGQMPKYSEIGRRAGIEIDRRDVRRAWLDWLEFLKANGHRID